MADEDSLASRYMANIDLLLKYISIRMYDGSTHTLLKSFELLERLIQMTEESQQQQQARMPTSSSWTDYEVQAVLPALIGRLGDAKEVVRARSRRLLTQLITHLYPPTKLFTTLLEHGVINKSNARIRQESLDCLAFLIRERTAGLGLSAVCAQPARAIPIIAQGIADRDSNVRTATLNVLVTVGEQLPGGADELWRLCGRIAEKERTMLEEKLKRSIIGVGMAHPLDRRLALDLVRLLPSGGLPWLLAAEACLATAAALALVVAWVLVDWLDLVVAHRLLLSHTQPQRQVPATQYSASGAKPMFSLDFDNLNLPSYSSATAEQLGGASGSGRPASLRP
ncbi:hypothetical protein H4S02_011034, partial [Coemansia sp. RSA 2611]